MQLINHDTIIDILGDLAPNILDTLSLRKDQGVSSINEGYELVAKEFGQLLKAKRNNNLEVFEKELEDLVVSAVINLISIRENICQK